MAVRRVNEDCEISSIAATLSHLLKDLLVKAKRALWMVAAVIAVGLAYCNSFHNGFHFDDYHTIVNNPYIRSLKNVPRFFTDARTFSVLPENRTYRPIVSTSLAFDYWLGHGLNPVFFHLGTFVIFLLQIIAMQKLFRIILDRTVPAEWNAVIATAAATLYGVHPAMAETVNYIIQRGDVYSTCGVVVALYLFAAFPRWRNTGLYLVPFALGLLCKPPAIVFPALLFAYVAMFEASEQRRFRHAGLYAVPALVVGAPLMWLQWAMTPKSFVPSTLSNYSYLITQPFVLLRYFGSFFLPLHLSVDSELTAFNSVTANAAWGFLFLAVLIAVTILLARRQKTRPVAFGLIWFLVASIPTSVYRLSEVENDHRMFMPFVGLVLAFTWCAYLLVARLAQSRNPRFVWRTATGIFVFLLCGYAWGTHVRNQVWHSEETLWADCVQKNPHNGRALMIYGLTQMEQGRYAVARDYFERALRYTPEYPTLEINLGVVYDAMGQPAIAEQHFVRAIALAPGDDQTHFFYGRSLYDNGRLANALTQLQTAFQLNGSRLATRNLLVQASAISGNMVYARNLANDTARLFPDDKANFKFLSNVQQQTATYWINASLKQFQQNNYAACLDSARKALAVEPGSAIAYNNIGAAYAGLMQWDLAVKAEQTAVRLDPTFTVARSNLMTYKLNRNRSRSEPLVPQTPEELVNSSLQLNQAGLYRESIAAARSALQLRPDYPEAWNNIAAGYASLGMWDKAIIAARQAIRLKPDFQLAKNNLAWALDGKKKSAHK